MQSSSYPIIRPENIAARVPRTGQAWRILQSVRRITGVSETTVAMLIVLLRPLAILSL